MSEDITEDVPGAPAGSVVCPSDSFPNKLADLESFTALIVVLLFLVLR